MHNTNEPNVCAWYRGGYHSHRTKHIERSVSPRPRGIFHLAGSGETSWAGFAAAIFAFLAKQGLRKPVLTPITSAEYPTPARRPANSRLDCGKLARVHGIQLPF